MEVKELYKRGKGNYMMHPRITSFICLIVLFVLALSITAAPTFAAENLHNAALSDNWKQANPLFWTSGEAKQISSFDVKLTQTLPALPQPGQEMDVFLTITNTMGGLSTGSWLELIEEYPFQILPTADVERAQNLKVPHGIRLQFRVKIADEAKDGIAKLQVRYGFGADHEDYRKIYFDIPLRTFDPLLSIEQIRQEPTEIAPGDYGKVSITLKNHGHLTLQNIGVLLDLTGKFNPTVNFNNNIAMQAMMNARLLEIDRKVASGESPVTGQVPLVTGQATMEVKQADFTAFTPIGSATQKLLPELQPGESTTVTFDVQALPDAKSKIYTTPLYVNYNDKYNNPFMIQGDVGLKVNMQPDVYVGLDSSTLRSSFFQGELTVKVANRGLSELRYITLKLGDSDHYQILTAPQETYIGTLNPGEEKTSTFQLVPKEKGSVTFPFTLAFKDSYNQEHTQKVELPLNIVNREYYKDIPLEWMAVWMILGIVMLILVAWYVRNLKKNTPTAPNPSSTPKT